VPSPVRRLAGSLDGSALRIGLVVARYHAGITGPLRDGALASAAAHGVAAEAIDIMEVPGAFELPVAARRLAATQRYDAIACVGAVVRGGTPHFDYVAGEASRGIAEVARDFTLPVTFGLITADTARQARERSRGARAGWAGNKGYEAMIAAIEMATLFREIDGSTAS
jgi:6,7-dimethyl-8-ribityllumazine synthase